MDALRTRLASAEAESITLRNRLSTKCAAEDEARAERERLSAALRRAELDASMAAGVAEQSQAKLRADARSCREENDRLLARKLTAAEALIARLQRQLASSSQSLEEERERAAAIESQVADKDSALQRQRGRADALQAQVTKLLEEARNSVEERARLASSSDEATAARAEARDALQRSEQTRNELSSALRRESSARGAAEAAAAVAQRQLEGSRDDLRAAREEVERLRRKLEEEADRSREQLECTAGAAAKQRRQKREWKAAAERARGKWEAKCAEAAELTKRLSAMDAMLAKQRTALDEARQLAEQAQESRQLAQTHAEEARERADALQRQLQTAQARATGEGSAAARIERLQQQLRSALQQVAEAKSASVSSKEGKRVDAESLAALISAVSAAIASAGLTPSRAVTALPLQLQRAVASWRGKAHELQRRLLDAEAAVKRQRLTEHTLTVSVERLRDLLAASKGDSTGAGTSSGAPAGVGMPLEQQRLLSQANERMRRRVAEMEESVELLEAERDSLLQLIADSKKQLQQARSKLLQLQRAGSDGGKRTAALKEEAAGLRARSEELSRLLQESDEEKKDLRLMNDRLRSAVDAKKRSMEQQWRAKLSGFEEQLEEERQKTEALQAELQRAAAEAATVASALELRAERCEEEAQAWRARCDDAQLLAAAEKRARQELEKRLAALRQQSACASTELKKDAAKAAEEASSASAAREDALRLQLMELIVSRDAMELRTHALMERVAQLERFGALPPRSAATTTTTATLTDGLVLGQRVQATADRHATAQLRRQLQTAQAQLEAAYESGRPEPELEDYIRTLQSAIAVQRAADRAAASSVAVHSVKRSRKRQAAAAVRMVVEGDSVMSEEGMSTDDSDDSACEMRFIAPTVVSDER
eukprot:PLAT5032.2.p1 GENE.PLAT5032.2~~PLAT5032.2.p1  ORF type:complete len:949 (+),score=382.70 PLAT5032.2:174-2849(+)